ncbi:uncharacterized protein A1O9_11719 [Exophiala aquamarina CBS 119918]|uniref:Complex I intermediate-associated protein 84, mitochondrial n=1 Tax=Exophiala aquamarina CBS 119918 TaxID=1182545 RepID=A0A072NYI9_9EURO|nr:uncharacterized protein A1O9_11719 [Exophiala aquamarina CBS 119918]KEF52093.1 hypothetical protein A1O9_11719 [Exophiala aquamarina CBS 119918]
MKASSLTRSVFRAILNDRPYAIRGCEEPRQRTQRYRLIQPRYNYLQTRHFFGFGSHSQVSHSLFQDAKPASPNLERALGKLSDLVKARRNNSRFPPENEIVDAFRYIFASRLKSPRHLTRNEVNLATEAFIHLRERSRLLIGDGKTTLLEDDLNNVLLALASSTGRDRYRSDARVLATYIFEALRDPSTNPQDYLSKLGKQQVRGSLLATYITVLSTTGSARDALDLLRKSWGSSERTSLPIWVTILRGLAGEGHTQELWDVLQEVHNSIGLLDAPSHEVLTTFLADHDEITLLKKIFELPLEDGQVPTTSSLVKALDCCIRLGEFEWAAPLAKALHQRTDSGELAGTLLLWYASHDDNVDHIRRRIDDMAESGVADTMTMNTINRIIQYAYLQHKPEKALEYIQLAERLGLLPDSRTRSLQLDYEIKQGNRRAASQAFHQLTREEVPVDRRDVPVLNRYIASLSFSADHEYDHLMHVVDHLLESGGELDAEAIAGLCHVFLDKDEIEEATGLLRYRVDSLPLDDRARIAAVFLNFIPDPTIQPQRAYNAYELLRHAFPETSVSHRLPLMQSFFDRGRPDLACLVFGHMRQRENLEARPSADAYALCFAGIAKCKDIDGLQMVYNMLKLDLQVEKTTRIHNSLIAAYTECQQPFVGIIDHFWKIMESREGPTISSFQLALRACEKWIPQGGHEARHIMALMQSFNLHITKEIYDLYIGALAGQSEFENVVELIDHMLEDIGEHPDFFTIGTFYNAIPWQFRKDEVEAWAKQAYPKEWAELESFGDEIDEEWEIRYFKIDRNRHIDMHDDLLFGDGEYEPRLAREKHQSLEMPKQ